MSKFTPLDLTAIHFPSDQVTLGQLRKEQPQFFAGGILGLRAIDLNAAVMIESEVILAEKAYAKALKLPDPYPRKSRSFLVGVGDDWVRYGLSKGSHQSKQMIRAIERAAVQQAEQHLGRLR